MCGISCYFCRESGEVASEVLLPLIKEAEKRGTDGFGYHIWNIDTNESVTHKQIELNYDSLENLRLKKGDLFMSIHRAAPETEESVNPENLDKTLQPIVFHDLVLIHNGCVSYDIVDQFKYELGRDEFISDIDSEAIIHAYNYFDRNLKQAMEYLVGGFSFILLDKSKCKLYSVCSHNPLFSGYVRGHGSIYSSTMDGVFNTISYLKGHPINKCELNVWEDYYANPHGEYTIMEYDFQSGMLNEYPFEPRYTTLNYDPYSRNKKGTSKVLVSASGGLDSSITLMLLKKAGMDPVAVHFIYGHRGGDSERLAIDRIAKLLDVPLITFDIEQNMKMIDEGMLTTESEVTTGTKDKIKTTAAWTVFRNHFFMTYMGALAESLMMKDRNLDEVFLTGGFMNLTESAVYPDNSEKFIDAMTSSFKFSVTGTRIKPLYALANLLKSELYVLLKHSGYFESMSPLLISCDRPKIEIKPGDLSGIPRNCCSKDGIPACGSGLLSYWAAKRAGVEDLRAYYEVDDDVELFQKEIQPQEHDLKSILNKIQIPEENMKTLIDFYASCLEEETNENTIQ